LKNLNKDMDAYGYSRPMTLLLTDSLKHLTSEHAEVAVQLLQIHIEKLFDDHKYDSDARKAFGTLERLLPRRLSSGSTPEKVGGKTISVPRSCCRFTEFCNFSACFQTKIPRGFPVFS